MKREEKVLIEVGKQARFGRQRVRMFLSLLLISLLTLNGASSAAWAGAQGPRSGAQMETEGKAARLKRRAEHLARLREEGGPLEMLRKNSLVPVQLTLDEEKGLPRFISGKFPTSGKMRRDRAAIDFLTQIGDVFMMSRPEDELRVIKTEDDDLGMTHVRIRQEYQGLRVFGSEIVVHFDSEGNIQTINGDYVPEVAVDITPFISSEQSIEIASSDIGDALAQAPAPELLIFNKFMFTGRDDSDHLAWRLVLSAAGALDEWVYFIDAHSGDILFKYNNLKTAKSRETYTADNTENLPGRLLIREGGSSSDPVAQAAQNNAGTIYDYYQRTFSRDSFDGRGAKITSTVHYSRNLINAFWNGRQMAYGDGDGRTARPLSQALDVVAHELTHAVTDYSADLVYSGQSGALNESFSDIFGVMVDREDWLLGEDIYLPAANRRALRSMADPTLYNQPDHMSNYVYTDSDNGGVHTNSGIQNKACYLLSEGGTHHGITVKGVGRDAAEKIFYRALTSYLTANSNFSDARNAAVQAAADIFSGGSVQQKAAGDAFAAVGIGTGGDDDQQQGRWTQIPVSADTPHPYPNNFGMYHYYSKNGARRVAIHFSIFDLEEDYDYVLVYDQNGNLIDAHTGTKEPFWVVADGDYIRVVLISDEYVTGFGYHIDRVAYFN